MKTVTKIFETYTFDELVGDSREKAINDCIATWMECELLVPPDALDGYNRAGQMADHMQTPWFWGGYIWSYCQKEVEAECSRMLYLADGEFFGWIEED